jgi:hypothetical protein
VFFELRLYYDASLCYGVGYDYDNINFKLEIAQKFRNCYKTVIKSLCDFTNWSGTTARYMDECDFSDPVTVELYNVDPLS